jgi:hypothetical protein
LIFAPGYCVTEYDGRNEIKGLFAEKFVPKNLKCGWGNACKFVRSDRRSGFILYGINGFEILFEMPKAYKKFL